ncbi:MAG: Rrf2 family transcriptional regulator [Phycisphaeraceae bacterium]|nr:Rrf2 family transcriptional regulator [Phycisphaeraceae bacterium]
MVSQSVEYALRAMGHLVSLRGVAATCEVIARATRVPQGYLSKIMRDLVRADLVHSHRGPGGGFTLARDARTITVLDVVNAVDPIRRIECCPLENPLHATLCPLHKCLDDALAHIEQSFRKATLGSVLDEADRTAGCRTLFNPTPRPDIKEAS